MYVSSRNTLFATQNETTGEVSSALNTAYTTIAVGISAHDGPPSLSPSRARDCLVKHVSSDPFVLAIKAYALACVQYREGEDMLKDLFAQAVETDKHIYWELGDASTWSKNVFSEKLEFDSAIRK